MIYIIGLGIEGKSSLSHRVLELIEGADMLAGGRRHLASFPEFKGKKVAIGSNLEDIARILNRKSKVGNRKWSVVLATGDPNFFGIADFLIKKLGKDAVEIISSVSAMQYAFAKIKENWNDARFFSLHGRNMGKGENALEGVIDEIVHYNKVGIFTDPENTPSNIAKNLLDKGIRDYKVYVFEDMGSKNERITEGTLKKIIEKRFSPLNVMILLRGQGSWVMGQNLSCPPPILRMGTRLAPCPCNFGISDSEFSHSKGMITKEEIRVISLVKLKLNSNSILWDIGAGCGSLSIEAALIAKNGKVFAIEKDKKRIRHIEKNKKRFNVNNLEIINKTAPDGLYTLPSPDAIFIGGGSKGIGKILNICSKKIKHGCRIVLNAITIETISNAASFFKNTGWNMEITSINIAKTKDVADMHLFTSYNPVFVIAGEKHEKL